MSTCKIGHGQRRESLEWGRELWGIPEYILVPIESEQTCPVRSISIQELIAVTLGFWQITAVLLVKATSHISEIY